MLTRGDKRSERQLVSMRLVSAPSIRVIVPQPF